ncbi:MAG TPA: hypothetical protein VLW85_12355 [Myxococcales bacterium]|nr:hypothetical protein [Myxococcales bacterium]
MRRIPLLMLILAAACEPIREEVVVNWTFGGKACDAAGVATITVDIAGEVLTPDSFTCTGPGNASQGVDLGAYLTGDYQITISGYDSGNNLEYQVTETLQVRRGGTNSFDIDVPQVAQTTGDVTLSWTFNGQTCAQAGITTVHVSADNQVILGTDDSPDLPCTASNSVDGATIGPFPAGEHSFDLVGLDSGGTARYALNGFQLTVVAGQNTPGSPDLMPASPTTAEADLTWTFSASGSAPMSCTQAGVTTVQIFLDPDANGNGGTDQGTFACHNGTVDGISLSPMPTGTHSFAILGSAGGHLLFRTHQPASSYFAIGFISDVAVSAESLP